MDYQENTMLLAK